MKKSVKWIRPAALAACTLLAAATTAGGIAAIPFQAFAETKTYKVDLSKVYQEFDGWGLSLSWWATEIGDWTRIGSTGKEKREEIAEALYGPTGLNLNIARYNVGGGDDQSPSHKHMTDDRDTPGWRLGSQQEFEDEAGNKYQATVVDEDYVFGSMDDRDNWSDWTTVPDHRQLWVLDWIQNEHGENGQNDYISEYYSNSPPYWMTITGCSSGGEGAGQNLDFANNQAFVDYFLDVYEYLTSQGFILQNLQPFNESGSYFWGLNGDQEGCYFSPQQKVLVLDLLRKEMERRGLDVPYNWGDETNTDVAYQQYTSAMSYVTSNTDDGSTVRGSDIVTGADRYTYHIYSYNKDGVQRFYRAAQQDGKEIYMSEICWKGEGDDKYDPNYLTAGFQYTDSIITTVKDGGVDAYVFWQGMEDMVGQIKSGTNYGLIQGVYYTQEEAEAQGTDLAAMGLTYQDYVLSKAYYMSGQFTKYIRQGYRMVDIGDSNSLAAVSPDGTTLVVVKNNHASSADSLKLDLKGFRASSAERILTDATHNWSHSYLTTDGQSVSDTAPANSVVTYVIKGERTTGDGYFADDSRFQNIGGLEAAEDELLDKAEEVQFYSNFDQNGGNAGHFGQTTYAQAGQNKYAAFRFYGTGFGITAPQKSDAGQFDIYIDALPDTAQPDSVDLYQATQANGETVYRNNTLEEGWHTVYLIPAKGSHGEWVNLDGVYIYTSRDMQTEGSTPAITSASGTNGKINFTYTAEGFEDCTIYAEALEEGATEWRRIEEPVTGGEALIDVTGRQVRIRLATEKDGVAVYSPVFVVTMIEIPPTDGVLYYVDCGTDNAGALTAGAHLGQLQSSLDKAFGKDAITGEQWGYRGTLKNAGQRGYYGDVEAMTSMTAGELFENDKIEYAFEIPEAGPYTVTLGFFGGSSDWGTRTVTATVGTQNKDASLKGGEYAVLSFDVTTSSASEQITVTVEKKAGETQSALLSNIIIAKDGVKLPLFADIASNFNSETIVAPINSGIGEDMYAAAEDVSFTLTYSDGSTQEYAATDEGVQILFDAGTMAAGASASASYLIEEIAFEGRQTFVWNQEGAEVLYYNIDCGFTSDSSVPPDDATELGAKQSTTRDRAFGPDSTKGTEWGMLGTSKGCNWENNTSNEWSIREGQQQTYGLFPNTKLLVYKMTGFKPNESLKVEISGHCNSGWGARSYDVYCNDTVAGTISLPDSDQRVKETFLDVKADTKGELEVICVQKTGDNPQVAYIKVWSMGEILPAEAAVKVDKTLAARDDIVTVSGIVDDAVVYMLDENRHLLGDFTAEENGTRAVDLKDYLLDTTSEVQFMQAVAGKTGLSSPIVVEVPNTSLDVELSSEIVRFGEYAVAIIKPNTTQGVMALTLTTPDGAVIDLTNSFYFRTRENGTYTVTLVSGGQTIEKEFTVNTIDAVDFGAQYSETGWTKNGVTITFTPVAEIGSVVSFAVDGQVRELAEGKFALSVTENGTHTASITTSAGFTYEETFEVTNIDASVPELELKLGFSLGEGLSLDFSAESLSGGTLHVTVDGQPADASAQTAGIVSLEKAGKYEIWFESGTGASTEKLTYYVTHKTEDAQLATVTVGADGTVSVTEKARAGLEYKLYRAGEETEVAKADKAGKYYLELTRDGETEIVVFTVAQHAGTAEIAPGFVDNTSASAGGNGGGNVGGMIAGIVIGGVALLAACVFCIMKGRKKS